MLPRDVAALTWLAEQYGAPMDVVGKLLQKPGQDAERAYAMSIHVVQRWTRAGWADAVTGFGPFPWIVPTGRWAANLLGWRPAKVWRPNMEQVAHVAACASARLSLTDAPRERKGSLVSPYVPSLGGWESERLLWRSFGGPTASAKVPDGVWTKPDGDRVLVEVELTAKDDAAMQAKLVAAPDAAKRWRCSHVLYMVPTEAVKETVMRARLSLAKQFGEDQPYVRMVAPPQIVPTLRAGHYWSGRRGHDLWRRAS
jgi:hypothetical protein